MWPLVEFVIITAFQWYNFQEIIISIQISIDHSIVEGDKIINDDMELAQTFNDFFDK